VCSASCAVRPARQVRQLAAAGIPVVVIDPGEEPGPDIRSVRATNWPGGLSATRHLIALGHRRIAAISGTPRLWAGRARLDGYRAAMLEAGLAVTRKTHLPRHLDGGRRTAAGAGHPPGPGGTADRDRGRQRRAGLRRPAGAAGRRAAGSRGPERGRVRRRAGRRLGGAAADHRQAAAGRHGSYRVPDAPLDRVRPGVPGPSRGACHQAGHPGQHGTAAHLTSGRG
jgi:hypothetical protein